MLGFEWNRFMAGTPRVSVLIPAYNVSAYIGEAITSVLAQTVTDWEIIVVNDGCPDTVNLETVLQPYLDRIVYRKQANGGPSAARNTALLAAQAPVVALLDADDSWMPEYLETQLAMLDADPKLALVYPNMRYNSSGPMNGRLVMELSPSEGEPTFEALVTQRCTVLNGATIRREAVIEAGMWDPASRHAEDYDLWMRIALRHPIAYHTRPLVNYRIREESLSANSIRMYSGQVYAYDKLLRDQPLTPAQRELVSKARRQSMALRDLEVGRVSFEAGDYVTARECFARANEVLQRPKLAATIAALRVAPGLLRGVVALRRRLQGSARA